MMKRCGLLLPFSCLFGLLLVLTACGGGALSSNGGGDNGGGGTIPSPTIKTSSLPGGSVGTAYAANLQATGGKSPYTWTVKSGTLPAGLALNASGAIAGMPTAAGTANALVFEVTDANKKTANSANLSLPIKAAAVPAVKTASLPNGTVGSPYSVTLQATGGSGVYKNWAVKSGTLPAGLTLNAAAGTITGTPAAPGIFGSLVFEVTDADTATAASGNLGLQVFDPNGCSAGAEAMLGTRPYAFLIKGFDASGPVTLIGSFTPDGAGGIASGAEDINRQAGPQTGLTINPAGSSYTLGADHNGCLTVLNSAGATITFRFAVGGLKPSGAFTSGRIIEFDDNAGVGTRASGVLRLQDTAAFAAGLNGMYAFLFTGADATAGHFGAVGSVQAAGGNFANLTLDYDDAGSLGSNLTGGTGTYSTADGNGRGTASFTATGYALNSVFYVVSSSEVLFASIDPLAVSPISSGQALATNGPFSAADLANHVVAHGTGLSIDGPVAAITTGTFDGVSAITGGMLTQDRAGAVSAWNVSGSYAVDSTTGRVAFAGNFIAPVGYIVNNFPGVSAFFTGNDFPATSGVIEPQTSALPAGGTYTLGIDEDADYLTANQVGTVVLGAGKFSGIGNVSAPVTPYLFLDQPLPATAFTFGGGGNGTFGPNTDAVTSGTAIYYIDETAGVTHPGVTAVVK